MTEVDFTQIELDNLITHHVGSPHLEEDLVLSQEVSQQKAIFCVTLFCLLKQRSFLSLAILWK